MIAERMETQDLDDLEIVDDDEVVELTYVFFSHVQFTFWLTINFISRDTDVEDDQPAKKKKLMLSQNGASNSKGLTKGSKKLDEGPKGPVARRPPTDIIIPPRSRPNTCTQASEFISTLSNALDPTVQLARDEERAARSMHTTQLLTISQSLRDTQHTIESLRNQLMQAQQERFDAERRADRAEMLSLLQDQRSSSPRFVDGHSRPSSPSASRLRRQHYMYSPRRYISPRRPLWPSPRHSSRHSEDTPRLTRRETFFPEGIKRSDQTGD